MDYSNDLAAIAKNLLNPEGNQFSSVAHAPHNSTTTSKRTTTQTNTHDDDQVFSVLQGMITTAQDAPKRRQPSHDPYTQQTRSGRRVRSSPSHKRVKTDDEDVLPITQEYEYKNDYNNEFNEYSEYPNEYPDYNHLINTNLLSSKLPSEDEDDEDYDVNGFLQQYQSLETVDGGVGRAPSEATTERERESISNGNSFNNDDRPKKKGRKAHLGTEEEKRERRLEQQRIAAARSRKNKKEELNKVEKDNEELRYRGKIANDRITTLEKELRDAKLHIYRLENEKLAVKGVNGQRHPAVKQLIESVQALVQATDGDGYDVLDKVDQEEAALTEDENEQEQEQEQENDHEHEHDNSSNESL
ncbi:hypothetical protein E3P92_02403 [Wallemia ichthyophaga]|uniref:BZIP domain-containing protein n=2 Tax=Wallemia ichthyophaga TaxID=245174 RepID=A0A4T0J1Y8_WALIC|nr:uncharacterized protein J056_001888 [Wallemia ichthyophaga EXF-994]TIA90591.1 hypothetical protein E3P97_02416 [Wallemia ichthyophaga]EOQ99332.1 hypothetical protein J056_001888 [Wallemia ichthyophaga EXF-994]TIA99428.1 hypothetical protein E3P95_02058 [Wallemia ichthyophaga]TIB00333.1 hypothetical protein E3P94_02182 [Wallemia ichthyophaga]TIB06845.1 hypothetical protein E3P96_00006 [Wallemia ichthyophaga]